MNTNQSYRILGKRWFSRFVKSCQRSLLVGAVIALLLPQTLLAAITSDVTGGVLTVTSDGDPDPIVITCDTANVEINGNAPDSGAALCATITEINVAGGGGADTIDLNTVVTATFTTLVTVTVDGGEGDDSITGSFLGDTLNGGDDDDTIVGHRGGDTVNGDGGNDTMIWNPGDGSDVNDGGAGNDTTVVNGGGVSETFTISSTAGPVVRFDRVDPAPFSVDIITTTENLLLNGNGGADVITGTVGLRDVITMTLNGGDGDDTITGGDGNDQLNGDGDNDTLTGFRGADAVSGGPGDDTMIWNNGDGSDTNDGGEGNDTTIVNGGPLSETFTISGTGTGVRFDRLTQVPFNIQIFTTTENLLLNGNDGDETVTGTTGLNGVITVTVNGGNGNDSIRGGDGPDTLNGEGDNDTLVGFRGPDTMNGGPGNDTMVWNNGDGSDVMDGGEGDDVAVVNGGTLSETFVITPSGSVATSGLGAVAVGSVFFQRVTPGPFSLDIEAESVEVNGNDGDDTFNVTPLDNTDVHFDGGSQSTADILRVNALDRGVDRSGNIIIVAGKQPVTHEGVETLEVDDAKLQIHLPFARAWGN